MDWRDSIRNQIASEAVDWFTRMRETGISAEDRAQFTLWLLRSPEHIAEYLVVAQTWGNAGLAKADDLSAEAVIKEALAAPAPPPNIVHFPSATGARSTLATSTHQRVSRRALPKAAIAAVAACITLAVCGWVVFDRWIDPTHVSTDIGEQRAITLEDGSVITLNTASEIRIDIDPYERRIKLVKGEVRFNVAKDHTKSFIVTTDNASVRALGTVFNVRALDGQTAVAVVEGRVAVSDGETTVSPQDGSRIRQTEAQHRKRTHGTAIELGAGERATVLPQGKILPNAGPPLELATNWINGQLVFTDETLATVIAELNRYQRTPIVIADPDIGALRVSVTYGRDALPVFIQYLKEQRGVRAYLGEDGGYILSRNP